MDNAAMAGALSLVPYEQTENHWVGSCADVAMVFAYEGASSDLRHVQTTARMIQKLSRELGRPVQLLFVVRSRISKPPITEVRAAIAEAMQKHQKLVSRAAVVVLGSGFAPAIHRSAITGLVAIAKPTASLTVCSTLSEGLGLLLGETKPGFAELVKQCDELLSKI